jgi:hypothetical protein
MSTSINPIVPRSSIPLVGGGDTHFHPWEPDRRVISRGFTVTTRLPGGIDFHEDFRIKPVDRVPLPCPGLLKNF